MSGNRTWLVRVKQAITTTSCTACGEAYRRMHRRCPACRRKGGSRPMSKDAARAYAGPHAGGGIAGIAGSAGDCGGGGGGGDC